MSLDVYLTRVGESRKYEARIFVREDGQTKEFSRREWDEKFPGREMVTFEEPEIETVYSSNITHNLNRVAEEAGIYKHLWYPEEIGISKASQLIAPLDAGLALMKSDPARFEKHNASNGWGLYQHFVTWVRDYLDACRDYPDADVSVSR